MILHFDLNRKVLTACAPSLTLCMWESLCANNCNQFKKKWKKNIWFIFRFTIALCSILGISLRNLECYLTMKKQINTHTHTYTVRNNFYRNVDAIPTYGLYTCVMFSYFYFGWTDRLANNHCLCAVYLSVCMQINDYYCYRCGIELWIKKEHDDSPISLTLIGCVQST